nr:unnamed protein product [Callosobruchus analis]
MSRKEASLRKKDDNHRQHQRAKSRTTTRRNMSDKLNIQNNFEVYDEANYVGPKPSESYCPNRTIEWKKKLDTARILAEISIKREANSWGHHLLI